ncbi:MAG: PLP-dependent aminotransferase family protein [Zestosphaera sp.]
MSYERFLSDRAGHYRPLATREAARRLEGVRPAKVVRFAVGNPGPEIYPYEVLGEIAKEVMLQYRDRVLLYGSTRGDRTFVEVLKNFMRDRGVRVDGDDEVIVTTGSQQALYLVSVLLINPGDYIAVENPTYLSAINAFRTANPRMIGVPVDENGMDVDVLEGRLKELKSAGSRIKFVYVVPVAHNPTGATMSADRKKHLIELASEHDFLIVEDDPYSYFTYEEADVTPLKTLDREGRVIYLSTMSKILAPALRVGWILAKKELVNHLERVKALIDIQTPSLSQYISRIAIERGIVAEVISKARSLYKVKRDLMLQALEKHVPEGRWVRPVGGLFIMIWLPESVDTEEMLPEAFQAGVYYIPGRQFFVDEEGSNTMRLNFSYPPVEDIEGGVEALGRVVRKRLS